MLVLLSFLLACQGGSDPATVDGDTVLPPRGDCNPVEDSHCMLPWPSEFFLKQDAARPSGYALDLGPTIEGTFSAPLYLTDWEPGSVLALDEQGQPTWNGQVDVPFTIQVPCSLLNDPRPGKLLQYGHGLLGTQEEVRDSWLGEMLDANGWIAFATDWTGMKTDDAAWIALMMVDDPLNFAMVPERTMQGWVEALVAARMMKGAMAFDDALTVDGVSLIEPETLWYYGNSQGGVLGGGYAAISPDIERVVLGVPGTPFTLLLTRAEGFESFLILTETMYDDWADISLLMASFQVLWDEGESAGYTRYLNGEPLDETTPTKEVLIQDAIGYGGVSTLGAHIMARAYGASLVDPIAREVWGLDTKSPPFEGSAIVEFDFGVEEEPLAQPGNLDDNPHWKVRYSDPGRQQITTFLQEGVVNHFCDGVCDPD